MSNPQKNKGSAYERSIVNYLRSAGFDADRTRAGWTDDRGDVHGAPTARAILSRLSARTTDETIFPDGSWNLNVRLLTQEETSVLLSTRNMAQQNLKINTPRSHSKCWCNSSRKQDTND